MKIGYGDYWIEIPLKDSLGKVKVLCKNTLKKMKNKRPQKLTIGLIREGNDFVYQRGVIKISLEQLYQTQIPLVLFRPPLLADIFGDKLLSATEEKGHDEPEDEKCDVYLYT
jgi:hypothetical protein